MTWTQKLGDGGEQECWHDEDGDLHLTFKDANQSSIRQKITREEAGELVAGLIKEGGFFVEAAIEALIAELERKQALEPCRETALIITKLEEALHWQEARMERVAAEKASQG